MSVFESFIFSYMDSGLKRGVALKQEIF